MKKSLVRLLTAVLEKFWTPDEVTEFLEDCGLRFREAHYNPVADRYRHTTRSVAGDRIRPSRRGRLVLPEYWDRKKSLDSQNQVKWSIDPYFNWQMAVVGILVGYFFLVLIPLLLIFGGSYLCGSAWQRWLVLGGLVLSFLPWPKRNARLSLFACYAFIASVLWGGWLTFATPLAYLLFIFLPFKRIKMLKADEGRTVERFGIPFREYGKNKGLWVCLFFEKSRPFWSLFLELEYEKSFQCTDGSTRPARIEVPIRIVRMWALQRLIATEILELQPGPNGTWKKPDEKKAITTLRQVFESDILALIREAFHVVPYPPISCTAEELAVLRRQGAPATLEEFALQFRQVLSIGVEQFFHGAVEVGEIGFNFLPSETEQTAAQRVGAAKDDGKAYTTKVQTIYDNLRAMAPLQPGEDEGTKNARCWKDAVEAAQKDLEREGLSSSGSGLAAGRAGRDKGRDRRKS